MMIGTITDFAVAAALLLLAVGLGHHILDLIGLHKLFGRERVAFSLALGIMAVSLLAVGLHHIGLLNAWLLRVLLAAGLLLTAPSFRVIYQNARGNNFTRKLLACSLFEKSIAALAAAQMLGLFINSLSPASEPPNAAAVPAPYLIDMLFQTASLIKGHSAARLLNLAFTFAATASVYLLARRFFTRTVGITAAGIFLLVPPLMQSVGRLSPEPAMTFFILLSFLALYRWARTTKADGVPYLVLISLLSAGIAGMKPTAGWHALFFLLPVILVPYVVFRQHARRIAAQIGIYAVIILAVGGGWQSSAYLTKGSQTGLITRTAFEQPDPAQPAPLKSLPALCAYPWNITMNSEATLATENPGPLFLAFIPLLLLIFRPIPLSLKLMLGYTALFFVSIFFTSQLTRYLIPIFGLTSIAAAVAFEQMQKLGRLPATAAIVAVFAASLAQVGISAGSLTTKHRPLLQTITTQNVNQNQASNPSRTDSSTSTKRPDLSRAENGSLPPTAAADSRLLIQTKTLTEATEPKGHINGEA